MLGAVEGGIAWGHSGCGLLEDNCILGGLHFGVWDEIVVQMDGFVGNELFLCLILDKDVLLLDEFTVEGTLF